MLTMDINYNYLHPPGGQLGGFCGAPLLIIKYNVLLYSLQYSIISSLYSVVSLVIRDVLIVRYTGMPYSVVTP